MVDTLLPVFLLHWAVLVTPGANVLVVSQLAASGDRRGALFAALGVTAVAVVWATLAVLGVHTLFDAHATLRRLVQMLGGLYLCLMALRLWRSRATGSLGKSPALSTAAAFRLGFMTNIMNPKSALFFGSVFATALPPLPSRGLLGATLLVVFLNALVWHVALALAFSQPRIQGGYARHASGMNRVAGFLVGCFGLRLLLTSAQEIYAELTTRH